MNDERLLQNLSSDTRLELEENILNYWKKNAIDARNGGFIGRITYDNKKLFNASKGAILNTRLLWTFSAVYKLNKDNELKSLAKRSYHYLLNNFWDSEFGGIYWMLDSGGKVINDRKHIYAQAFAIYALSEYASTFDDEKALKKAIEIYELIEIKSSDNKNGGYFEAFSRDWRLLEDVRLSEKDINVAKSMNTHLHLLEAYSNLYRYWKSDELKNHLVSLVEIFLNHIITDDGKSQVNFIDVDWTPKSDIVSFGHDLEASWLLIEAAERLGDFMDSQKVKKAGIKIAESVLKYGLDRDGGLLNEASSSEIIDDNKQWWPQAEALLGFLNAYEYTRQEKFLNATLNVWNFIVGNIRDKKHGEWLSLVNREGHPYPEDKVNFWKGPYHNSRACLGVIRKVDRILKVERDIKESSVTST